MARKTTYFRTRTRLLAAAVSACFTASAYALPSNPTVVNGSASFAQAGNVLNVTNSNGAILNWNTFSIGANETTRFIQPSSSSSVLNRVLADPSVILGSLTSNGRVFLINPNGIYVGQGARIDVAGFVASTLSISNANFFANKLQFDATPNAGSVVNQGSITTPSGGTVYLVAPNVSNQGIITTPQGETILAAGQTVTLLDTGTPGVSVEITGAEGNATNLGTVVADAGRIGIAGVLVKNSGTLNASSAVSEGGRIFLRATQQMELTDTSIILADGSKGGNVTAIVSDNGQISGELKAHGELSAQGNGTSGSGGFIETSAAKLDVDGINIRTRGGEWLLDPVDVTIFSGGVTDVSGGGSFSPTSAVSIATLATALSAGSNVTIDTNAGSGGNGDITLASALAASTTGSGPTLTLNAFRNININQSITASGGSLNLALNANSGNVGGITAIASSQTVNLNGGTLSFSGGNLNLSGTLKNATLTSPVGRPLMAAYGTLDSVTIGSNLSVSGGSYLYINNNLTLANGITVNEDNGYWYFTGTPATQHIATPGTATINVAGGDIYQNGSTATLQIDSGITLQGYGYLYSNYSGASIANAGVIIANTGGQSFNVGYYGYGNFTNSGSLSATAGTLNISPSTFTNNGTASVSGGTLTIAPYSSTAPNWSNAGSISVSSGTLNLGGLFNNATIAGHLTRTGGVVNLSGTLDNGGNTLNIGSAGLFGTGGLNTFSGTIKNGTLVSGDGTVLHDSGGTLDTVTIGSNLSMGSGSLYVKGDLTLANGVAVNMSNSTWYFNGTAATQHITTAGTATINDAGGTLYANASNTSPLLQIDSGITLQGYGQLYQYYTSDITNAGMIDANTGGQTFYLNPQNFTNNATIKTSAGNLNFNGTNVTNASGGTITVAAGTTATISPTSFTNAGAIVDNGATLNITPSGTYTNTGTLALNAGTLNLGGSFLFSDLGSGNFTRAAGTILNMTSGTLDLGGGTLDIGSGGLFGTGGLNTFSGTIKNGTLVSGDGTVLHDSGGTLDTVTIGSNLSMGSGSLYVKGDLTLANGVAVNMSNSTWYFNGTAATQHITTVGTATINDAGGTLYANASNTSPLLQIDSGITLQGYGQLYQYYTSDITNAGMIDANTGGQTFYLNPQNFTNNATIKTSAGNLNFNGTNVTNASGGTITVAAGTTATISPTSFTNAGAIVDNGATLNITPSGTYTNTGTLALNAGTLNLGGSFLFSDLGSGNFTRAAGTILNMTSGTLDLGGGTLDIGSGGLFGTGGLNTFSGTIKNGTLVSGDGTVLHDSGGTLDTVTIGSNLSMGSGSLYVKGDLTLANGVAVNMSNSTWYFNGTAATQHITTVGTATINDAGGTLYANASNTSPLLQIDSGITLQGYGQLYQYYTSGITNAGTIDVASGQTFNVNPQTFTNNGTINLGAGSTFYRNANFTSNGTLSGSGAINLGGNTLTNNGIIAPGIAGGDNTGMLSITGNLAMGSGSNLNVDLNSPLAGDFDMLSVTGSANLNGTLNLAGGSGVGSYVIVNAAGGLGGTTFTTINVGTFTQTPTYAANNLTLAVTANSNLGIYWDGGGTATNWADALNWSNDLVPNSASTVYIGSGAGTVAITSGSQAANALACYANFNLSAGSLTLTAASTFAGTTTISGGTLTGTGPITIATGGTLNWSGGVIGATAPQLLVTQIGTTSNITGGMLDIYRTWNNSGTLNVTPATWTKYGVLNHTAGILNLNGSFTTANIFAFNRSAGSTVNLAGTLDNTSNTLDIGGTRQFGTGGLSGFSGTIKNGTLVSGDGTVLTTSSGTLDSVTIGSNLSVGGSSYLYINNDLTLANGITVNLKNNSLYFNNATGTQHIATPGTATINDAGGTLYGNYYYYGATALQIDSGITLQGYGTLYQNYGTGITNAGTIIANTVGQPFNIDYGDFTNSGTLSATAGTLDIYTNTFTNSGTANVNGGTLTIRPYSSTAPNWTNAGNINISGGTLNLGGLFSDATVAGHLTRTGGTVNLTGTLDNTSSTLDIGSAGLFGAGGLGSFSGTIKNGTLVSGDGTVLTTSSGTLDSVTLGSNLSVGGNSYLYINNDLTLANGITVNLKNNSLYFNNATGTQHIATPGTATINDAGGTLYGNYYYYGATTLQIDSGITLQGYGTLYQNYGTGITNAGTIIANTTGQTFSIDYGDFTNSGTLSATAGTLDIYTNTFTNSGTANVNGGTLTIRPYSSTAPNWTNAGNINISGGTLNLGGLFSDATVAGHLTRTGGTVNLTGTLDNISNTLDIGSAGLFGTGGLSNISGTIKNGTLVSGDGTVLTTSSGTLDSVTLGSNLSVGGNSYLYINNDLTLANGITVNLKNNSLYFNNATGTQHIATPGTATINDAGGTLYGNYYYYGATTLQIDSGITLQGYGTLYQNYGTGITNAGTIIANTTGQTFSIDYGDFTNSGTLSATAGTLDIYTNTFTNSGTANVNGGTLSIRPYSSTAPNWTNAGNINLSGGTLNLGGLFSNATLSGHLTRTGGMVNLTGTLDNTSKTLDIGSAGLFGTGGLGSFSGTIKNGTLVSGDGTMLTNSSGTLDSVSVGSNLSVGGSSYFYVKGDLTLGSGVTFNLNNNSLYFNDATGTQHIATPGTATINDTGGTIYGNYYYYGATTLQIDSGITLQGYGSLNEYYGTGITNAGTIVANTAGQAFNIYSGSFTNSGTLSATAGTLYINPSTFTNNGTVNASNGATATIDPSTAFTNSGTLHAGAFSTISTAGHSFTNASSGLIKGAGIINLGGASYTLTNDGTIKGSGGSTGITTINGNLVLDSGSVVNIQLGGQSRSQPSNGYDGVVVTGALTLGGTMNVTAVGSYVPANNDTFLLFASGGAMSGSLSVVTPLTYNVQTTANDYLFQIGSTPAPVNVWNTNSSGAWTTAANWSLGVPTASQVVLIDRVGASPAVTLSSGAQSALRLIDDESLTLSGGSLALGGTSSAAVGTILTLSGGTLNVNAGTFMVDATMTGNSGIIETATGAAFQMLGGFTNSTAGILRGVGTFEVGVGNTLTNYGTISPGAGASGTAGTLTINGNLLNGASGVINAELGGASAGTQYDVIGVSGSATLGGTLNAPLISGFSPTSESFDVITAGTASGSFATSTLPPGVNGAIVGGVYRLTYTGIACSGVCWDGGAGTTNWADANNWSGNVLPGSSDITFINLVAGVNVNHTSGTDSIKGLNTDINNNLTISGGSLTLNDASTTSTLAGNLSISGGTLTANGTLNASAINLSSGTLNGSGALTVSNSFTQTAGVVNSTGALSITQTSGNLSLGQISAKSITAAAPGVVTLNGALSANGAGNAVVLAGTGFVNNIGASAISVTGGGRWLVWSGNPASDTVGGLVRDFTQYNATYGATSVLGSGNGLLYSLAPIVSTTGLIGTVSKVYDGTATASPATGNFSYSGQQPGDVVTLSSASAVYGDQHAGTGKTVTATGLTLLSAKDSLAKPVYGYQFGSSSASGAVGTITPAPLTITANNASKTYGQTATFAGTAFTSSALQNSETIGSVSETSTGAAATAHVTGSPYAIVVSGATGGTFAASDYNITYANGNLAVNPATLTVSLTNTGVTKPYDGTTTASFTPAYSISGLATGDTAASFTTTSQDYNSAHVASANLVTVSGLAIGGITGSLGSLISDYSLGSVTSLSSATGSASITPAVLTVKGNWSAPSSWIGGILPENTDILGVLIASSSIVAFDGVGGPTAVPYLTSASKFSMTGGALKIAGAFSTVDYSQTGGALTAATVNINSAGSISKTGGDLTTPVLTTVSVGGTNFGGANAIGSIHAENSGSGDITLSNTGALAIAGINNTGGNIAITNSGPVSMSGSQVYTSTGTVTLSVLNASSLTLDNGSSINGNQGVNIAASGVSLDHASTIQTGPVATANVEMVISGGDLTLNDGSHIKAGNDVLLTLTGPDAQVVLNGGAHGPSTIETEVPFTTHINFETRTTPGGIVIDGTPGTTTTAGGSGFYAAGSPATEGKGLAVLYPAIGGGTTEKTAEVAAQVIDQTLGKVTETAPPETTGTTSDDDKKKKKKDDDSGNNEGKDNNGHHNGKTGQCT